MIFILPIHATGVLEGVTLLAFEGASQEEEPEVQAIDEAAAEEELPECPDHRPDHKQLVAIWMAVRMCGEPLA